MAEIVIIEAGVLRVVLRLVRHTGEFDNVIVGDVPVHLRDQARELVGILVVIGRVAMCAAPGRTFPLMLLGGRVIEKTALVTRTADRTGVVQGKSGEELDYT